MYAIIELGGHQWKVEPGTQVEINRIPGEIGSQHRVERVLLAHDGHELRVGRPYVEGSSVVCELLAHRLGPKVISYHFRRRDNWRKTVGHRQPLTRLVVKEILIPGGSAVEAPAKAAVKPVAAKTTRAPKATAAVPTKKEPTRAKKTTSKT